MLALVYVFFMLLYVALSVVIVIAVGRWAAKRGKVRWKWMTGAAAAMWLIVFWDWIPTLLLHRHLCNTWAGVTIYKTPEQWLAENKDKPRGPLIDAKALSQGNNSIVATSPGERFAVRSIAEWYAPLTVQASNGSLVDRIDAAVLAERREVHSGYPKPGAFGGWRRYFIWLQLEQCSPEIDTYYIYANRIRELAKELR